MPSPEATVISARGLVKEYGEFRALGPVDVTVGTGATGLLGPNGAGKTTLIKTLLGLVTPTLGSAHVLGLDIVGRRLDVRQAVGYMPEIDAHIPSLSGVGYVAYAGELAGLPRADAMARAHEMLNYVGVGDERYRLVDTYSTGMRQKAKLAQAIVHDPKVLFLDEPTNGLDPKARDEMLSLIRDIATRKDMSILLSTHLLPDVEYVCRNVVVLNKGQVVAQGGLKELQSSDGRSWMVRIKGAKEPFLKALDRLRVAHTDEDGFLKLELPTRADGNVILEAARTAGVQVRHLTPKRSTLEELFVDLVADKEG